MRHLTSGSYEANVAKSYLYAFLMDFALWMPIWVLYLQDRRGLSLTQITFLDVPFFLLIVVAQVPAGVIADRFGRKYSIMIGAAFFAVAVLVFGLATNYPLILTSYILWSLAVTFRVGADSALLYDTLKQIGQEERFHGAMGRLWATRSTALLAGLLLGAPLASATNFSFTFEASAGLALAAIVVALWMHEPRHVAVEAREAMGQTLLQGVGEAWRQPAVRYVILYSGVVSLGFFGPVVIFQQPWLAEHGVATQHLGLWQAPARAGEIAAALGAGWLLLRMGERARVLRAAGDARRLQPGARRHRSLVDRGSVRRHRGGQRAAEPVPGELHQPSHRQRAAGDGAVGAERGAERDARGGATARGRDRRRVGAAGGVPDVRDDGAGARRRDARAVGACTRRGAGGGGVRGDGGGSGRRRIGRRARRRGRLRSMLR